jgi:hypothetical protein
MNIIGSSAPNDLGSFSSHAWQLSHQVEAFGKEVFAYSTNSVGDMCGRQLAAGGYTEAQLETGLRIRGEDLTALFLNQALEYFQKSFYNFVVQYLLARRGLLTWAEITNYYSSFFSVHALLCLQGKALTRVTIGTKQVRCQVVATDLVAHEYVISSKGAKRRGGEHEAPWKRYYEVYDRYNHPVNEYEVVYKRSYVPDPIDELSNRQKLNYFPFQGFQEILFRERMEEFKGNYLTALASPEVGAATEALLQTLKALVTDPFFNYFARVALRLLFAADVLKRVSLGNAGLKQAWDERVPLWRDFSAVSFSVPAENFMEDMPKLFGHA